ncbi:MAG: radical SAM protein [Thermoplasmata archaeon]|nr:radical SAM protein [Thermoplasmata archaeon]
MLQPVITAYKPGPDFPSISITANKCALDCAHCGGRYLEHMIPAPTPPDLQAVCRRLWEEGKKGVLISGGCDRNGTVPLEPFMDIIGRVKAETGLILNVHTGFVDRKMAEGLARAKVDVVSLDVVGSKTTIQNIYGLDKGPEDHAKALSLLLEQGIDAVPHVCIGLDHGRIVGERHALEMVKACGAGALVFIVLMPTKDTRMAGVAPPPPKEVGSIIAEARKMMPDTRLLLGCMRPRGAELERAALEAGVDGIVLPRRGTREWLKGEGVEIMDVEGCCVLGR